MKNTPEMSTLGKKVNYVDQYDNSLLFPIPRKGKRDEIGIDDDNPPFKGYDLWTGYEISFLNQKGKPIVAVGLFTFPADSRCLVESKSFKLYLNSFNQSKFENLKEVEEVITKDLSKSSESSDVKVSLYPLDLTKYPEALTKGNLEKNAKYHSLDHLDIEIDSYNYSSDYLKLDDSKEETEEFLCSNLLKSNCLVTGQPDWGSIYVHYLGYKINHESLLRYLISFRQHNEFHEQCVERVFSDIMKILKPEKLTVYARYTRRGGLDINPFRSNFEDQLVNNFALLRQ